MSRPQSLLALGPRLTFAVLVVVFTWVGEEFPSLVYRPWWYQYKILGVPFQYVLFGFALVLLAPYVLTKPQKDLEGPLRRIGLWRWSVLSAFTVGLGIILGIVRQSGELFVDWRNWVILIVTTIVASRWLSSQPWKSSVLTDISIAYGLMSTGSLVRWLFGGGTDFYELRVPNWYGYNLMLACFAAIVAAEAWLSKRPEIGRLYRYALGWASVASALVVVLSFRRSFWLLLLAGIATVAWRGIRLRRLRPSQWLRLAGAFVLVVTVTSISFGLEALTARIASINPSSDNEFSNTNSDHLGDMIDALGVIASEPVFGLGIGSYYQTVRIIQWKTESFEVHNAFINVWLKFGLLGLITYIGFHYRFIRALFDAQGGATLGIAGAGIYMAAEQIPSMIQTWPYNSIQVTIHHGILLAVLLLSVRSPQVHRGRDASSMAGV